MREQHRRPAADSGRAAAKKPKDTALFYGCPNRQNFIWGKYSRRQIQLMSLRSKRVHASSAFGSLRQAAPQGSAAIAAAARSSQAAQPGSSTGRAFMAAYEAPQPIIEP